MPDDRSDSEAFHAIRSNLLRIHPDLERTDPVAQERYNLIGRAVTCLADKQLEAERPRERWWRSAIIGIGTAVISTLAAAYLSGLLHLGGH